MRAPDLVVGATEIWRRDIAKMRRTPDHQACLGEWLIHMPGVHAFWSYWYVTLIHLRDIEGVRPAVKSFERASHEIMSFALDPDVVPDPDSAERYRVLTPIDIVHQFEVESDRDAVRIGELLMKAILAGQTTPDTDQRRDWVRLIDATAEHFRAGRHLEN